MSDPQPAESVSPQPQPVPSSVSRRAFLSGSAAGVVGGGVLAYGALKSAQAPPAAPKKYSQAPLTAAGDKVGMPGPFPGRVVEIHHPQALTDQKKVLFTDEQKRDHFYTVRNRAALKQMIDRGMRDLVQCDSVVEAWKYFFQPGDRVGIKIVPVGKPDSISSHELVLEVIDGLQSAGVRLPDMLVFDRYRDEFVNCKYHEILPEGVRWGASSAKYDDLQLELDGQTPNAPPEDHVFGYDPHVYRELAFADPAHDVTDDRRFRSHLSNIMTKEIDKLITLPVLKDHRSSGVTLALKNMSHGLVNNVARSHIGFLPERRKNTERGGTLNQCGTFIPAMVSLPTIREKAVLHILDGLVATYEGGPGNWNKTFATWPYQSLFFATDPVALDHVGWEIIDAKRAEEGWPGVGAMGLSASTGVKSVDGTPIQESFHIRQPEHIALAATLGLGVFDRRDIKHDRIEIS